MTNPGGQVPADAANEARAGANAEAQTEPAPPPWRQAGTAVAIGSFPGDDPDEPVRIMAGETSRLPSIPELPARGPGADMIGRTLSLLSDVAGEFAGETTTTGWRLAGRYTDASNRAMRRAHSWLAQDFDVSEAGYAGARAVKCAIAGPWTVAAAVELPNGHRLLSDPGAMRDLTEASIAAAADLARRLRRTWPAAVVQIDEPALPAALSASVSTPSGLDRYRAVPVEVARSSLTAMVDAVHEAGAAAWFHCCAVPAPVSLLISSGADAISIDLTDPRPGAGHDEQAIGQLLEGAAASLVAGVVSTVGSSGQAGAAGLAGAVGLSGLTEGRRGGNPGATAESRRATACAHQLLTLLDRLGVPLDAVADRIVISPACGLAGASEPEALAVMKTAAAVAAILARESGAASEEML